MKKYKIAWKALGGIKSASFRYRALLPCKYLKQEGWPCEIFRSKNIEKYQVVVFQKLYDELSIELVKSLQSKGIITVFDLCDNHFYYQLENPSALAKRQERLQKMIDVVDIITVSTPELKKLISSKTDKMPFVIDDAIETPKINILAKKYITLKRSLTKARKKYFKLVWYGNAGTENPPYGMIDLVKILPYLEHLNQEIPIKLSVISNSIDCFQKYTASANFSTKFYKWQLSTFPYLFSQHDLCIIPVNLNDLTRYKTNNRVVLSLLLGVPVIADRIPSYEEFSKFLLFSDWEANLRKYARNSLLRQQHTQEGKKYILTQYNQNRVTSQWSDLFQQLLA